MDEARNRGHARNRSLSMRPRTTENAHREKKRRRTSSRQTPALERQHDEDANMPEESNEMVEPDVYDPNQPAEERRETQRKLRDHLKSVNDNSEAYMEAGTPGLREAIERSNELLKQARQPSQATIDSRILVSTTEISYRKTLRFTQGSLSQGIDVDELVSKCAAFMREGNDLTEEETDDTYNTGQGQTRSMAGNGIDEDEDTADEGDMMNWAHLGAFACLPGIRRPALPGFMLGPLSVERKSRRIMKRSAPLRPNNLTQTQPEVLNVDELAKKENDLAAICGKVQQRLISIQAQTQEAVIAAIDENMEEAEKTKIMHDHGLRSTGGIDLMRFVTNPDSFGQTVENLFYVSFLIREGKIAINIDELGLPALAPATKEATEEGSKRANSTKNQAILSIDVQTWQHIVDVMDLNEPMIEHRQESGYGGPGASSWYS